MVIGTAQDSHNHAADDSSFSEWQAKVAGTNISTSTLLATDYLNHYNEVVMIVEMIPDMPEMLEDIADWRPISYAEHFRQSGLSHSELAIAAYAHVPAEFKQAFEETVEKLDQMTLYAASTLRSSIENGMEGDKLRQTCAVLTDALKTLMQTASGIINGSAQTINDEEINRILGR